MPPGFAGKIEGLSRRCMTSTMALRYQRTFELALLLALWALVLSIQCAHAVMDEIQVYNAEIAKVGQWTLQSHSNYAISGRKNAEFEGGIIPNHSLNGTPELAYGVTEWWEMGFYAPYSVGSRASGDDSTSDPGRRQFLSDGGKIRQLFVTPNAAKREFFYGVNFEFSYATPWFSPTRWNLEIRPIVGVRKNDWEFIVNPIVDTGFGVDGEARFAPCARLARNFGENFALGLEYYTDLGPLQNWLPLNQQEHNLYGVVDFKIGRFDVNAGIGYGLTSGSDRWMAKMIIGTELNEGVSDKSNERPASMRRPRSGLGSLSPIGANLADAFLPRGY
jgi:hypothetical protein